MDSEVQDTKKASTLKVTPEMVEEQICAQLENLQQIQEFTLDLFYPSDISLVFQLASLFLKEQNNLNTINISIESNTNIQFGQTLYLLKDLTKITDLSIDLRDIAHFDSQQQITFSQCFYNYTNLQQLSITINSKFLDNKVHLFRLYDVYQRNANLTKLEIIMIQINDNSLIPHSILSGINCLTKLEHFELQVFDSKIQMSAITEFLEEQLKEKTLLKVLKLKFGQRSIVENSTFISINRILNGLKGLETLSVEVSKATCRLDWEKIGIKSLFASQIDLKWLKMKLSDGKSLTSLIETVALMKQLERVDLSFRFHESASYDKNFEKLGECLAYIQFLHSLKLKITQSDLVSFFQLNNFISGFHQNKSLKVLSIYTRSLSDREEVLLYDQEKLNQTISNLRVFKLIKGYTKQNSLLEGSIHKAIIQAEDLEVILVKFKNYLHCQDENHTDELMQQILDNKKKLESTNVTFTSKNQKEEKENEDNHNYQLISKLCQNPEMEKIKLHFKEDVRNSHPHFKVLSQSIMSHKNLKELKIKDVEDTFQLNDYELEQFTQALKQIHGLVKFKFNFQMDNLEMKSVNNFTAVIHSLKKLSVLQLEISSDKTYEDEEQLEFAKGFLFPENMHYLNLKFNLKDLKFKNIEDIYANISKIKKLKYLDIDLKTTDMNYFDCVNLKNYLTNLKQLKGLEMFYYTFPMLYLISLFQEIQSLNRIFIIYLNKDSLNSNVTAKRDIFYKIPDKINGNEQKQNEILQEEISLLLKNIYLQADKEVVNDDSVFMKDILDSVALVTELKLDITDSKRIKTKLLSLIFQNMEKFVNLQQLTLIVDYQKEIENGNESLNSLGKALITLPRLTKLFLTISAHSCIDWRPCSDFISCFRSLRSLVQFQLTLPFEYDQASEIKQQTVIELFQNMKEMKKLNRLEIQLENVILNEDCVLELNQMFSGLKENLRSLKILVFTQSNEVEKKLINSFQQLEYLQSLTVYEFQEKKLRKLARLVDLYEVVLNEYDDYFMF